MESSAEEQSGFDPAEPQIDPFDKRLERRDSVAILLRRARVERGENLPSIAQSLCIRYPYLQAIEDGSFGELPGPTYAVGFVRSYAEYLELDGDEMVRRFKEEVDGIGEKTELVFPTPVPEGKVPGGAIILISVLLIAVIYGGWYSLSNQGKTVSDLIPPVPERLQAFIGSSQEKPAPEAVVAAGSEPVSTIANPVMDQPGDDATDGPSNGEIGQDREIQSAGTAREPTASAGRFDDSAGFPSMTPAETAPLVIRVDNRPTDLSAAAAQAAMTPEEASAGASESDAEVSRPAPAIGVTLSSEAGEPVTLANVINASPIASNSTTGASEATATLPVASSDAAIAGTRISGAPIPAAPSLGAGNDIPPAPETALLAAVLGGRTPQVFGADNEDARIVLRARLDSWVQVRDVDEALLLTRVLRQGDEYRVPNRDGLTLQTGNAGGIDILVDGTMMNPIGPVGSVRRNVALDPERLVSGTAFEP